MKPARHAALELLQRHDRVLRARDPAGKRRLDVVDIRREQPIRERRQQTSVGRSVRVDQHVEIDDAAGVVVRAPAGAVEEHRQRVRAEAPAQDLAERGHGVRGARRELALDHALQ